MPSKMRYLHEVPSIEVYVNANGHISIKQDKGTTYGEDQIVTVDRARVDQLIDMLRTAAKEYDEDPPPPFEEVEQSEKQPEGQ